MRLPMLGLLLVTGAIGAAGIAPQGTRPDRGISAEYPGDRGIAQDPDCVFAEDFDAPDLETVVSRWTEVSNRDGLPLTLESSGVPGGSGGCLRVTATLGHDTGGHLYKLLDAGEQKLHARFYVLFDEPPGYVHHFVTLGGYNPPTPWPQGGAGERPVGDDRMTVGIEPSGFGGRYPAPGVWNFYAYWHEMKISADGRYWGNAIAPEFPDSIPAGRWQCVEVGLELNTFGPDGPRRDGRLALWIDGEPIMEIGSGTPRGPWTGLGFLLPETGGEAFEGFSWRTDPNLQLNFFWLMHYVTEGALERNGVANPPATNTVWFDQLVLARRTIGPMETP